MNKSRISRREFLRLSTGLTAAGITSMLAASCAPQPAPTEAPKAEEKAEPEPAAPPAEAVSIQWWHGWGGMTGTNAMQAVADAFNKQSDTVYVERLQVDDVHEKYLTAIAGGAPPDAPPRTVRSETGTTPSSGPARCFKCSTTGSTPAT